MLTLLSKCGEMRFRTRNNKGWLRIVESSIAILIVIAFLVVIGGDRKVKSENDLTVTLRPILDEIANNFELRNKILSYNSNNEETELNNAAILGNVTKFVSARIIHSNLGYRIRICSPDVLCGLESFPLDAKGDIYAEERVISASVGTSSFQPKKLKIFLWRKSS